MEHCSIPKCVCSSLLVDLFLFLLVLAMFVEMPAPALALRSSDNDCQTLLNLKPLLGISTASQTMLSSWKNTVGCCQWFGVNCSSEEQPTRVTELGLASLGLTGMIPPSLANLTFLQVLDLSDNKLHGAIPSELGSLRSLQILYVNDNSLEGEIPESLGWLPDMQEFDFKKNNLKGVFPVSLLNCSGLIYLSLSSNNFTGGIPPAIGNLSSLTYLHLAFNNLEGIIPADISRLTELWDLDLQFNSFTGNIPAKLYNLSSLGVLALGSNMLSGTLPMDFGNYLPNLEYLYLYENRFEGHIPSSITNASSLRELSLSTNSFTGDVPPNMGSLVNLTKLLLPNNRLEARGPPDWSFIASLSNCVCLKEIDLTNNTFGGSLQDSFGNLSTSLQWLRLRFNQITGKIPAGIGNLSGLLDFDIEHNHISGPIPSTLGNLLKMDALILRFNELSGEIPPSLGNLFNMSEFFLNNNNLSGSIPESFGSLKKLIVFDMSYNGLGGSIPKQVIGISSLSQYLNLSHNVFVGTLPSEVGKLRNLKALDVSHNRFSGEIPRTLADCQLLDYLNLQGNCFNGTIPEQLSNLKAIQFLDLSQNQLYGPIPKFLERLPLQFLNLSFNNLEGEVPTGGIFSNLSMFSIIGNENLCGGNPKLNLKPCSVKKDKLSKPVLAVIVVVAVLIFLVVLLFLLRRYISRKSSTKLSKRTVFWNDKFLKLSYQDLHDATDGFSASNLIGRGGFGAVYRGVVKDSEVVAIKVFNREILASSKSFDEECRVLRNIRHRNLVRVLSACSTVDSQGNEFKALVYEFIPNGSLDAWLHRDDQTSGASKVSDKLNLNVRERLDIAIDVAAGIDYLHNQIEEPIVHRDLKPSNILLDDDMTAHICDFGISRILPPDSELMTTGIKGTIGYIPPESAMGSRITTSRDVYSFGVLLLEMFTGKRPIELEEGLTLHRYVEESFPEDITEIIDKRMLSEEKDGEMTVRTRECIIAVIAVALSCSKEQPKERMDIRDALKQLEDAKNILVGVGSTRKRLSQSESDLSAHLPSYSYK